MINNCLASPVLVDHCADVTVVKILIFRLNFFVVVVLSHVVICYLSLDILVHESFVVKGVEVLEKFNIAEAAVELIFLFKDQHFIDDVGVVEVLLVLARLAIKVKLLMQEVRLLAGFLLGVFIFSFFSKAEQLLEKVLILETELQ